MKQCNAECSSLYLLGLMFEPGCLAARQRAACLQKRLEMGKDLRPAARDAGEHFRVALETVVDDRQANEPTALRLDFEADTRVYRLVVEVIRPRPGENQAARRGILDNLADHIHCARVDAPMFPAGT